MLMLTKPSFFKKMLNSSPIAACLLLFIPTSHQASTYVLVLLEDRIDMFYRFLAARTVM